MLHPVDWGVTSGCDVTSGDTGTSGCEVTSGGLGRVTSGGTITSGCDVTSGGLGTSYRILRSDWLLSDSQKGHVTL